MSTFNLVHCLSTDRRMHGFNAYHEVIETLAWGLSEVGHQVVRSVNQFYTDATNVVFGAQALAPHLLAELPRDTIIYNFEQVRGLAPAALKAQYRNCVENFKIWEYSAANMQFWEAYEGVNAKLIPVGYAPLLNRIPKAVEQDIDVLIYGLPIANRLDVFNELCQAGLKTVFICGFYGAERDAMIARAKVVLNIQSYGRSRVFEIVRVSYLWANSKAVIADLQPDTYVDEDLRGSICFAPLKDIVETCLAVVDDPALRAGLERQGFEAISKRDIREILKQASI